MKLLSSLIQGVKKLSPVKLSLDLENLQQNVADSIQRKRNVIIIFFILRWALAIIMATLLTYGVINREELEFAKEILK